jgi:G:T-mismatch repair DNA endonuclease (very short patch repair protein)
MTRRSAIEIDVEHALWGMRHSLEFLSQQRWVSPSRRTYTIDFRVMAWDDGMLEVNGCHWHRHGCAADKGTAPLDRRARDARLITDAEKAGFPLAIVWECAIAEHGVKQAVLDALAAAGIRMAA